MTDNLIFISVIMSEFTGETGFSFIKLSINDNTHTQSPTNVNEDDILFTFHRTLHILTIYHCTRIIINRHPETAQFFRNNIRKWTLIKIKDTIAVPQIRIYTSRKVYINIQNFILLYRKFLKELFDYLAQLIQTLRSILCPKRYIHL